MRTPTVPMKLVPRYLRKPWGGRRIPERFSRGLDVEPPVGESWELYDRPDGSSGIANGPFAGQCLADVRGELPLPLMTKIIDAQATLSVQVHPDVEAADELGGESKTEAWYVLESAPDARIYKGLTEGTTAADLLRATEDGTVADRLVSFRPEPGDVVFLPPGTVHAIGGGLLLFEVQQNSDTTYRLFDWNRSGLDGRPRPLHVREAIRCADFAGPGLPKVAPRLLSDDGRYRRTIRVSCPEFVMEEQEILGLVTFDTERDDRERWHVLFVLDGEGTIRPFDRLAEDLFFSPGDSILLPAEHAHYEIVPRAGRTVRLLTVYR